MSTAVMDGLVILQDRQGSRWLRFQNPKRIIATNHLEQVVDSLRQVEKAVNEDDLYAAGFLSYEAAPSFDPAIRTQPPSPAPLLWFGLFDKPQELLTLPGGAPYELGQWQPSIEWDGYRVALDRVKAHIGDGETYQVNYTFHLRAQFEGDPWGLFIDLIQTQQAAYSAYVDTGEYKICSASPELFFELDDNLVTTKPMKGTARRGLTLAEDNALADWLLHSEKNRAENVMIVDMIRNDLGRVSVIGSVCVPRLFEVTRYPTLWQMTSTVTASTRSSLVELMTALFPCASITGAPKIRTMQIIADLETGPRGIYTGCIGYIAPGRRAQFNVAIRSVVVDIKNGAAEYGVGGGIVWDSDTTDEYLECQTKAQILTERRPQFRLLESIRWTPVDGYTLLNEHLTRLANSAQYFDYKFDRYEVNAMLAEVAANLSPEVHKVRLLVGQGGEIEVQAKTLAEQPDNGEGVRIGLAAEPINSGNVFLYHKSTHRVDYEQALASRPDCEEVLLWNERGELTESTTSNVVFDLDGVLVTPPVESGLLGGTYREKLLADGVIREQVVLVKDLERCQAIFLINSVRGWRLVKAAVRNLV